MTAPKETASRGLIRSMLVIGSAQAVNIVISIIRMKMLAMLLGPAGVGILSIYNNLQTMVAKGAGLGMGTSGVREIASARGEEVTLTRVRRVLFAALLVQGVVAMLAVWLLRAPTSTWLFGDSTRALEVGLVGVTILLALLAMAQRALLQGLRRINDLGWVTVLSALIATIAGLMAVWVIGEAGLIWFLLVQQLVAVMVALYFTRRLPKPTSVRLSPLKVWQTWKPMAKLGLAFMLGGLATAATLLFVRGRISHQLGLDAAGHFAAAWGITMTYVGFLLGAMGADYYPRLTEVISDRMAAIRLMNDQAQLGLAIGGPVLLLLIGLAPWVITLLYSPEFGPAVALLQWQTVGNVFKLASWALSFSIVAAAYSKTYFFMELSFNIVFLGMVLTMLPVFGLQVTAYGFVAGYMAYLLTVFILVRRLHDFRWEGLSLVLLALHSALATALLALALMAPLAAALASIVLAGSTGIFGVRVVLAKIGNTGRLPSKLHGIFDRVGWPIKSLA